MSGAEWLIGRVAASIVRNLIAEWPFFGALALALVVVVVADLRQGRELREKYGSAGARIDMTYALLELTHIQSLIILSPVAAGLNGVVDAALPWLRLSLLADAPFWIKLPLIFALTDLAAYWWHRAKHASPWLWQLHKVHHSQPEMTLFTRFRFPVLDRLASLVVLLLPMALLTGSASFPLAFTFLVSLRSCLEHSGHEWTYGPLGRIVVSPAYHSLHHSVAPEHRDRNFGAFLTIWDRLFGTTGERGDAALRFGVAGEHDCNSLAYGPTAPLRGVCELLRTGAERRRAAARGIIDA